MAHGLDEAFKVLRSAITDLQRRSVLPTASQVRLEMKQLTYGGFEPKALGFKRFRDFLAAAEQNDHISVHERPGDLVVALPGDPVVQTGALRIRRDLWRAALDWSPRVDHYLDLDADRVEALPKDPVPLEPEPMQKLRARVELADESLVRVPRVSMATQLSWMSTFTDSLADDEMRILLQGALATEKPAKLFTDVLRNDPQTLSRWHERLTANVSAHLQSWKERDERLINLDLHVPPTGAGRKSEMPHPPTPGTSARRALIDAATAARSFPRTDGQDGDQQLRALLHRAIDRMGTEELRQIWLPLGYVTES
jgi:hypothetical protein